IYIIYILIRCRLRPELGPPAPIEERVNGIEKIKALRSLVAPGLLISAVLGCIIFGITSPSEAAAIGAFGALVIAALRGRVNLPMLRYVMLSTTKLMGMLIWIALAAGFFSKIYLGLGAGQMVGELIEDFDVSPYMVIVAM